LISSARLQPNLCFSYHKINLLFCSLSRHQALANRVNLLYLAPCTPYFVHLCTYNLLLQRNFLHIWRPTMKHVKGLQVFCHVHVTYSSFDQRPVLPLTRGQSSVRRHLHFVTVIMVLLASLLLLSACATAVLPRWCASS
jgi:hypothetical protein